MCIRRTLAPALLLIALLLPLATSPLHAQNDPAGWRLTEARDVYDELIAHVLATYPEYAPAEGQRARPRWDMLTLAPDGSQIVAWGCFRRTDLTDLTDESVYDSVLCRFDLDSDDQQCVVIEREDLLIRPTLANTAWSPDSTQIALTDNFFDLAHDGDILLLDVETLSFTNLTDDGYNGYIGYGFMDDAPASLNVDVVPIWSPQGDLYFFRIQQDGDNLTNALYRLVGAAGEPELVMEFLGDIRTLNVPTVDFTALSPDGNTLAMIPESYGAPFTQGLMLLDLTTPTVAEWIVPQAMQPELAPWSTLDDIMFDESPLLPRHVLWSGDEQRVIVCSTKIWGDPLNVDAIQPLSIDLATGTVTPLVDYTQFANADAVHEDPAALPGMGILAPDGLSLFYVSRFQHDEQTIFAVPVSFDAPPVAIGTLPDDVYPEIQRRSDSGYLTQATSNGRALYGTVLLTFEQ